jgi:hypothetical protein
MIAWYFHIAFFFILWVCFSLHHFSNLLHLLHSNQWLLCFSSLHVLCFNHIVSQIRILLLLFFHLLYFLWFSIAICLLLVHSCSWVLLLHWKCGLSWKPSVHLLQLIVWTPLWPPLHVYEPCILMLLIELLVTVMTVLLFIYTLLLLWTLLLNTNSTFSVNYAFTQLIEVNHLSSIHHVWKTLLSKWRLLLVEYWWIKVPTVIRRSIWNSNNSLLCRCHLVLLWVWNWEWVKCELHSIICRLCEYCLVTFICYHTLLVLISY